jgi:hypothetical protein
VARAPTGEFVVVWRSNISLFGDSSVFGQRFDGAGAPQGPEFQVNTYTTYNTQRVPSVATDPAGNFLVTWAGANQDGDLNGIFAQAYDSAGAPQGGELQVNTYTTADQYFPSVAAGGIGNFLVAWRSFQDADGSTTNRGQRIGGTGTPIGGEFQINTYTTGGQSIPSVAAGNAGNFVVAWQSYGEDGSTYGIFGQRLRTSTDYPIPVKVSVIKPSKLFKFVAKGTFTLPDPATDNPTTEGGQLLFAGVSGGQTYALASGGWKGLGPGGDGSKGFKFKGDPCKAIIVKNKVIKGVCKPDTGDFGPLPDAGPVNIILTIGTGTTRYCGACGGTPKGNDTKIFKRKDCAAPPSCP